MDNAVFCAEPEPGDPQVGDRAIVVDSYGRKGHVQIHINCEWATTEGWIELDAAGVERLISILQRVKEGPWSEAEV